jgi:hypothetical protein
MQRSHWRRSLVMSVVFAGGLVVLAVGQAAAQASSFDRYLNHDDLTRSIRSLAGSHGNLATVTSLAKTEAGRDIWLLTLGRRQGVDVNVRPALLIVANLEANHVVGSSAALFTAEHLLTQYGRDAAVTKLLDERTVYIIPRANPDGAELVFTLRGFETPYKPFAGDAARGGLNVRELGRDLNGDGLVTLMRVRDPEGRMMVDPADARVLKPADRTRAERGSYRVMVEGIDPDSLDAHVPMGTDGVNLNRNFPHEYLYFQPHVGPHMVSEVESRTLADFVHDRHNIAAVLTFSFHDNLRTAPPAQRSVPQGVTGNPPNVPTNILPADRPFFEYISSQFQELTGLRGEGAENEAGSFPQFVYYQLGLPSFTTPVWTLPPAQGGGGAGGAPTRGGAAGAAPAGGPPAAVAPQQARGAGAEVRPTGAGGPPAGVVPQQARGAGGGGPPGASAAAGAPGAAGITAATAARDARWLAYFDSTGVDAFVQWTPARHPTLGDVEVGGFRPNMRVNPPASQIRELAEKHAVFATWLAQQLPAVQVVDTKVEPRGDNVYLVTATLANEEYLPTQLAMGERVRFNRPITVRLLPAQGVTVLTGNPQQQVPRLEGMGDRSTFTWLVQAAPGTRVTMEVFAERAGGLQSVPLTLR